MAVSVHTKRIYVMGIQSVPAAKVKTYTIKSVSFVRDIMVLNLGTLAKISSGMVTIKQVPEFNGVLVSSTDSRYKDVTYIPMSNVAAMTVSYDD